MINTETLRKFDKSTHARARSISFAAQAVFYHLTGSSIQSVTIHGIFDGDISTQTRAPLSQELKHLTQATFDFGLVCLSGRIAEMHDANRPYDADESYREAIDSSDEYVMFKEGLDDLGIYEYDGEGELIYSFGELNKIFGEDVFNLHFYRSIHDRALEIITTPKVWFAIEHLVEVLELKGYASGDEIHSYLAEHLADTYLNLKA